MNKDLTPEKIMQLGLGFWSSKTLLSAIELGVFSKISEKGPQDCDSLSQSLNIHPRSARDFFDALVALGMLNRDQGLYSNTTETDLFLDREKPSYVGGMLEMANHRLYKFWGSLTDGLRTGQPQNEVKVGGEGLFDALYGDPATLKAFLKGMTGLSMGANVEVARKFPWQDYKTFMDIGGAEGGLIAQVALAHPHISGGVFDLPVVHPFFDEYVESFGLGERLEFRPGNFFEGFFPKADVLAMGHILHDWNIDEKRDLIDKAYKALPEGGALIVIESIIDDDRRENAFGLLMSLNMLIETPGGFDFTGADCRGWLEDAGFRETRCEHLAGPASMVIGIK